MRTALMVSLVLAMGCSPTTNVVEVQGVTQDGPFGPGLEGVTLTAFDATFEELDRTESETDGWYRLEIPRGEPVVYVSMSGEGFQTTTFSGEPGQNPRVRVPNDVSIAFRDSLWGEELERWEGCPGLGEGGAILGTVQIADIIGENGDPLAVTTGDVRVQLPDESVRAACYLGADGTYDPEAVKTGDRATFLLTRLSSGLQRVTVSWNPIETETSTDEYVVWVPENAIAPRFPLLVNTPFDIEL